MIFFLIYCLFTITIQSCLDSQNSLMQSGSVIFNTPSNSKLNVKIVQILYQQNNFQILVSSGDISNIYNKFQFGFQWSIKGMKSTNKSQALIILSISGNWKIFNSFYFISSHKDIILGTFILDTLSIGNCMRNKQLQLSYCNLRTKIKIPFSSSISKIPQHIGLYISGIKASTLQPLFSLQILQKSIDQSTGILTVIVSININDFVRQINFAYFIVLTNSLMIDRSQGQPLASFIGVNGFYNWKVSLEEIAIFKGSIDLTCIGKCRNSTCITDKQCKKQGGVIQGSNYCYLCQQNTISYQNKECIIENKKLQIQVQKFEKKIRGGDFTIYAEFKIQFQTINKISQCDKRYLLDITQPLYYPSTLNLICGIQSSTYYFYIYLDRFKYNPQNFSYEIYINPKYSSKFTSKQMQHVKVTLK